MPRFRLRLIWLDFLLVGLAACREPPPADRTSSATAASSSAAPTLSISAAAETTASSAATSAEATVSSLSASATSASADKEPELFGPGSLWGDEDPRGPLTARIRMGATTVNGRLPPEVIQRIVRRNFGKLRLCYDTALGKDPLLSGRVTTSFTIDTGGAIKDPKSTSEITDKDLLACFDRAFRTLSFPAPEGGVVKVVYPFLLDAPAYAFTIGEKLSTTVAEADVVKALETAGYKVSGAAAVSQPTVSMSHFKAEKAGVTFSITLDPKAQLPLQDFWRLKKQSVLLQDGAWCLFVESSDKLAAQALVDAIHKKLPRK